MCMCFRERIQGRSKGNSRKRRTWDGGMNDLSSAVTFSWTNFIPSLGKTHQVGFVKLHEQDGAFCMAHPSLP